MSAATAQLRVRDTEPQLITLLELVRVISEVTDDEREIVATVTGQDQTTKWQDTDPTRTSRPIGFYRLLRRP